jgi:hypothetical protein
VPAFVLTAAVMQLVMITTKRTKDTKVSDNQISELRDLRVLRGECSLTLILECAKVLLAKAQGDRHE